jgi:hypothetical protein
MPGQPVLIEPRKDRIAQVVRDTVLYRGQVAQKPRLFRLVAVEDAEIGGVVLVGLAVHVATQLPQQVGLPAFDGEMGHSACS